MRPLHELPGGQGELLSESRGHQSWRPGIPTAAWLPIFSSRRRDSSFRWGPRSPRGRAAQRRRAHQLPRGQAIHSPAGCGLDRRGDWGGRARPDGRPGPARAQWGDDIGFRPGVRARRRPQSRAHLLGGDALRPPAGGVIPGWVWLRRRRPRATAHSPRRRPASWPPCRRGPPRRCPPPTGFSAC